MTELEFTESELREANAAMNDVLMIMHDPNFKNTMTLRDHVFVRGLNSQVDQCTKLKVKIKVLEAKLSLLRSVENEQVEIRRKMPVWTVHNFVFFTKEDAEKWIKENLKTKLLTPGLAFMVYPVCTRCGKSHLPTTGMPNCFPEGFTRPRK